MKYKAGLTCAGAGVDIDAGNAMVEKIKPLARATRRPGADAKIGGFGGIFDFKAAGFTDPILRTFTCGIGMVVVVDSGNAAEVLRAFASAGEDAVAIGRVVAIEAGERVVYSGRLAL